MENIGDWAVRFRLSTSYSHAGLLVADPYYKEYYYLYDSTFSKGVRKRKTAMLNPDEWLLLKLDITESEEKNLASIIDERYSWTKNDSYDYLSWLGFLFGIRFNSSTSFYCFEYVMYLLTGVHHKKLIRPEDLMVYAINGFS